MWKNPEDKKKYMKKYYLEHRKKCSCDKLISGHSVLCHSCAEKKFWDEHPERKLIQSQGKNNPMFGKQPWNYKGIEKKCKCLDCGKKIAKSTFYRGQRCKSCENKRRWQEGIIEGMPGDKNPNWQGGISFEPYSIEWTEELREFIRKRDNYTCQNCGLTNEEHLIVYDRSLTIHHIDYNKKNCSEENLISLCVQCNSRANFNRSYWLDFYKNKVLSLIKKG